MLVGQWWPAKSSSNGCWVCSLLQRSALALWHGPAAPRMCPNILGTRARPPSLPGLTRLHCMSIETDLSGILLLVVAAAGAILILDRVVLRPRRTPHPGAALAAAASA